MCVLALERNQQRGRYRFVAAYLLHLLASNMRSLLFKKMLQQTLNEKPKMRGERLEAVRDASPLSPRKRKRQPENEAKHNYTSNFGSTAKARKPFCERRVSKRRGSSSHKTPHEGICENHPNYRVILEENKSKNEAKR